MDKREFGECMGGRDNYDSGLVGTIRREEDEGRATRLGERVGSSSANDYQHGGQHYRRGGYQHWDFVNDTGMDYYQGNATKYVSRWRNKNGIEDLKKAEHYLTKAKELQDSKSEAAIERDRHTCTSMFWRFAVDNDLTFHEGAIIYHTMVGDLWSAIQLLQMFIEEEEPKPTSG